MEKDLASINKFMGTPETTEPEKTGEKKKNMNKK